MSNLTLIRDEEESEYKFEDRRVYLLRLEVGHLVTFDGVTYKVRAINDFGIDISRVNSDTLLRIDVANFVKNFETVRDFWAVNYYN